jgi:hypothetical protein
LTTQRPGRPAWLFRLVVINEIATIVLVILNSGALLLVGWLLLKELMHRG